MAKFTEGPWVLEDLVDSYQIVDKSSDAGESKYIATIFKADKQATTEELANATLLTTAPDLHNALKEAYMSLKCLLYKGVDEVTAADFRRCLKVEKTIEKALIKAETLYPWKE